MERIRKNDTVKVLSGKDRDKTGKVLRIFRVEERAIVEGLNMVKKHMRRSQQNPQGGIITREAPLHLAKLQPVCPRCNRPARVAFAVLKDGSRSRICVRCREAL